MASPGLALEPAPCRLTKAICAVSSPPDFTTSLPIDAVLDDVRDKLNAHNALVVVAPPGAGKTTRLPLALMQEWWLEGRKIIMLEPRRLAARGAAAWMARALGEKVGAQIGVRARLGTAVSADTRIEVVTEGVFTRMILEDPALDGIGLVILDEFHERSLDADFALALVRETQQGLRDDLKVLVMSATLDGARVASLLDGAPVIVSEGRSHPVETRYVGRFSSGALAEDVSSAIVSALRSEPGSILVFLPGQAEIRRVETRLRERIDAAGLGSIEIAPLHGGLDPAAQDRAIAPAAAARRKVVLATSIAETSLTIEGVRVVVDCGLARVPMFEPDIGTARLRTVRVSRAAAEQRKGRAGRTGPGICIRLWDEPETQALPAFADPEIANADLSGLLLDCAAWGVKDPAALSWLDTPPAAAVEAARTTLTGLGALDESGQITAFGRKVQALPLPAHLAAMVLRAVAMGAAMEAAEIAAVLVERGLGGNSSDLDDRLAQFKRDRGTRASQMRQLAAGWARLAQTAMQGAESGVRMTRSTAALLALAYPGRIAKARSNRGGFLLANGRGASIDETDPLAQSPFLVVAEMQGGPQQTRVLLATRTTEPEVLSFAGTRVIESVEAQFDAEARAVRARRVRRLDALVLDSAPRQVSPGPAVVATLLAGIRQLGVNVLPWSKALQQTRARVTFVAKIVNGEWPDLSDQALEANIDSWLGPFVPTAVQLSDISTINIETALAVLLPYELRRTLDEVAPTHFTAPTSQRHPIDYEGPGAPIVALRVQELFGLDVHPVVAGGKVPLTLKLLSPSGRPIQVTRDLPKFWRGSWRDVRAEMRGRYPKHVWPEDPRSAAPTTRAKPRRA
mgnify:CR=1 FL=1